MNPDQSVGFCDSEEVGPPLSAKNNAAENIFSNSVLWRTIGSYLNVGDLKACRLVNSEFHAMVTKETNFLKRCVVSLKPNQISRNVFGTTSDGLWKNVLLKFQSPGGGTCCNFSEQDLDNLDWLYPIISNVECLRLRMENGIKSGDLSPLLKRLLLAPQKLRSLAVEPIFLLIGTDGNFEDLKQVLGNLQEFQILQPSPKWLTYSPDDEFVDPWKASSSFIKQLEKLRVVRSYYPQMMSTSTLPQMPRSIVEGEVVIECELLTSYLTRIAHQSSKTLKHVTLGESRLFMSGVYRTPLPFLPNESQPGAITEFFEAMPMLQELDFTVRLYKFPLEVLDWMKQTSACLRKVKLESCHFMGTKWEFLEQTKLEEFQLGVLISDYPFALPNEALRYLPSTIRRLILRGPLEANPTPALTRLNPTLVTQLTFIDSGNCFGNDAIKYIRENFVMLRKLNVTNAKMVTDAGFIGSSSGSGSMSGMKGLRTLILRKCGSITDATLKEIRFFELSHLDLAYNDKLTEDGFERVLSNNPSLETLLTSCKDVYRKREHLCASHPRLSSLIYRGLKAKKKGS